MRKRMSKKAVAALVILFFGFFAAAAFLYLPIPALEARRATPEAVAAFEARGTEHFARVLAGRGLDRPFPEMPERPENPTTAAKVELGRLLYFDPILSGDDTISCAHCHHPDLGFVRIPQHVVDPVVLELNFQLQRFDVGGVGVVPAQEGIPRSGEPLALGRADQDDAMPFVARFK